METYRRTPLEYPGICRTYGRNKAFAMATGIPALLHGALCTLMQPSPTGLAVSAGLAACSMMFGFVAAVEAHEKANEHVSEYGFGMTRGGKIVRKAQAAAFAAPLVLSLAFNAFTNNLLDEKPGPSPVTHALAQTMHPHFAPR